MVWSCCSGVIDRGPCGLADDLTLVLAEACDAGPAQEVAHGGAAPLLAVHGADLPLNEPARTRLAMLSPARNRETTSRMASASASFTASRSSPLDRSFTSPVSVTTSLTLAAVQTSTTSSSSMARRVRRSRFHDVLLSDQPASTPISGTVSRCETSRDVGGRRLGLPMTVQQLRAPVIAGWIASARESIESAAAVPTGSLRTRPTRAPTRGRRS